MPLWEPTQIPLSLLKFQLSTPTGNTNNIFVNQLSMCFPLGWKACTQEFVQSVQSLLQLHSCLFILLQPQWVASDQEQPDFQDQWNKTTHEGHCFLWDFSQIFAFPRDLNHCSGNKRSWNRNFKGQTSFYFCCWFCCELINTWSQALMTGSIRGWMQHGTAQKNWSYTGLLKSLCGPGAYIGSQEVSQGHFADLPARGREGYLLHCN